MSGYDPRKFWSSVAQEAERRPGGARLVAGDDTPFYRLQRETFVERLLLTMDVADKSVLEVGCGPGGNLRELSRKEPRRLVGCDISPDMLRLARETTAGVRSVELVEVDGRSLPFADGEFEVTFTVTVLNHDHDEMLEEILAAICRVTRSDLYLCESVARRKAVFESFVARPPHEYHAICALHGFELVDVEPLGLQVSQWVTQNAGRGFRTLGRLARRKRRAGEPISAAQWSLERALLPVTRKLDRFVAQRRGLVKMHFRPAGQR